MTTYKIESNQNEDTGGVDVWIVRNDGEMCSLQCAENEGEMYDGQQIPDSIINKARAYADRIGY